MSEQVMNLWSTATELVNRRLEADDVAGALRELASFVDTFWDDSHEVLCGLREDLDVVSCSCEDGSCECSERYEND